MSVELVKTTSGEGQYKRKPVSLPTYEVQLDGKPIGVVRRAMVTHKRRTPGKCYVDARWQSPGWMYGADRWGRYEVRSRREGVERLLRDAGLSWTEAEELSAKAKVIR